MRSSLFFYCLLVLLAAAGYFGAAYFSWSLGPITVGVFLAVFPCVFTAVTINYEAPKMDTAYIRTRRIKTDKSKEKVAITGGLWLNIIIHKIIEIPLNTMQIEIVGQGDGAFLTSNFRRCDLEVTLSLRIAPDVEDILKTSQAFRDKSITPETVQALVKPTVKDVLECTVAETNSPDLIKKRHIFVNKVLESCKDNLKLHYGITLEEFAIQRVYMHPEDWNADLFETASKGEDIGNSQLIMCDLCGNEDARLYFIPRSYGKDDALLVIEDVPIIYCPNCGEDYLTAETLQEIERIKQARQTVAPKRPVAVAVFK